VSGALRRAMGPALLAVFAVALVAVPAIPSACPMRLLLHVPCPSCGLTRAARLALGGDFGAATRMHPLWFLVLPYVGIVGAAESVAFVRTGRWGRVAGLAFVRRAGVALVALLIAVWVARWFGAFGGPVSLA
jgi:hypothetical protein